MSGGNQKPRIRWSNKRNTWRIAILRDPRFIRRWTYLFLVKCKDCGKQDWRGAACKVCRDCTARYKRTLTAIRAPASKAVARCVRVGLLPKLNPWPCKRQGKVIPIFCVDCGKPAEVYDHRDYSKPLEVEPVCRACNSRRSHAEDIKPHVLRFRAASN